MSGAHLTREFFELVKGIGEARSKQEEDRIIVNQQNILKAKFADGQQKNSKKLKELLIRMIYVEMLGHEASFGYIHAVNMAHETNILEKRVGYLTVCLCLNPDHELMILLVNTLQRDLKSSNWLEVIAALTAMCKLLNQETIPALIPLLTNLLTHNMEVVRKKAVMALLAIWRVSPDSVTTIGTDVRKAICDKDPSVMGAAMCLLYELVQHDPTPYKDLVASLVSILKQITEHRLPRDYDYHRMPAPWIQIRILRILACLGQADQRASEGMYEILQEVMKRADTGINVGYAVIYECVRTTTIIYPNTQLLASAANSISRFIGSDNHNLKYLGVNALASIVQVNPKYALEHQMVVIDCMEDPDETLKRKTLDLLFRMTNPSNVTVVVEKLITQLRSSVDAHFRSDLVSRLTQLAERYAPNNVWFIETMNCVFELGGDLVRGETAHNLMRLIAEGGGEDDQQDEELRAYAVNSYLDLMEMPKVSTILLQVISWVLGEYGYLAQGHTVETIIVKLTELMDRHCESSESRGWVVTAMMKLTAQAGRCLQPVMDLLTKYSNSKSVDLQQRVYEFQALLARPSLMKHVLPVDASCEDLEVDSDLPFLQPFVDQALANGGKRYKTHVERMKEHTSSGAQSGENSEGAMFSGLGKDTKGPALKFDAYEQPSKPSNFASSVSAIGEKTDTLNTGLKVSGPRKWGAKGYGGDAPANNPPPQSAPQPPTTVNDPEPASQDLSSFPKRTEEPSKPVAAAPPPEPTEKEKLASALFGGVPTGSTAAPSFARRGAAARSNGPSKPQTAPPVAEVSRPAAPVSSPMDDLLSLDVPPPAAPTQQPGAPLSTQPPPPGGLDLMSLMNNLPQQAEQPVAIQPFSSAVANAVCAGAEKSQTRDLCANAVFKVRHYRALKNDTVVLVTEISNVSGAELSALQIAVEPAPKLSIKLSADSPATVQGTTIVFGNVSAGATVAVVMEFGFQAFGFPSSVGGTLSAQGQPPLHIRLPLPSYDFLRPHSLQTAGFGQQWMQSPNEKKVQLKPSPFKAVLDFLNKMKSSLHLHLVESKGSEGLAAGVLLSTGQVCLMHAKLGAQNNLDVTVRTKSKDLTDLVLRAVQESLQK